MSDGYRPPPAGAACPEPGCGGRVRLHEDYGDGSALYDCTTHPWGSEGFHGWYRPHADTNRKGEKMARAKRQTSMTGAPRATGGKREIRRVSGVLRHGAFDVEVGSKTLLYGPPSSGKTSVCNAITLALRGIADDVAGRDNETKGADLYRHLAAPGAGAVEATVTLTDGSTFTFNKVDGREAEGVHLPADADPFVVSDFAAVLTGSAPTQRKWLAKATSKLVTEEAFTATARSLGFAREDGSTSFAFSPADLALPPIDRLDAYIARREGDKRTDDAVAKDAEREVDANVGPAGLLVTDDDLARFRAIHEAATTAAGLTHDEKVQADGAVAGWTVAFTSAAEERARAEAAVAEAVAAEQAYQAHVARFPAPARLDDTTTAAYRARLDRIAAIRSVVVEAQSHFQGRCPTCATTMPGGAFAAGSHDALSALDGEAALLTAALEPPDPYAETRAALRAWTAERRKREERATEARTKHEAAHAALTSWSQRAALPVIDTLVAGKAEAAAALEDAVRRHALHKRIDGARAAARAARERGERAKRDIEGATEVRNTLARSSLSSLSDAVSRYLPDGERFHVEYGASWVRFGLVRGGVFRSAVAGAESARMLAAVAAYMGEDRDLAVVIVPERQFDGPTLTAFMRALANAPVQVVAVSTVRWEGKLPAGWTVVDLTSKGGGGGGREDERAGDAVETTSPTVDAMLAAVDVGPVLTPTEAAEVDAIVVPAGVVALEPGADLDEPEASMVGTWWVDGLLDKRHHDLPASGRRAVENAAGPIVSVHPDRTATYTLHRDGTVIRTDVGADTYRCWSRAWLTDDRLPAAPPEAAAPVEVSEAEPWKRPEAARWLATLDKDKAQVDVEGFDPTRYLVKLGAPEAICRVGGGEGMLFASGVVAWTNRVDRLYLWASASASLPDFSA